MVELQIIQNQKKDQCFEFTFFNNQLTLHHNISTNFVMSVKAKEDKSQLKDTRAVLVAKIRNSSVIFSFPLLLIVGDANKK